MNEKIVTETELLEQFCSAAKLLYKQYSLDEEFLRGQLTLALDEAFEEKVNGI